MRERLESMIAGYREKARKHRQLATRYKTLISMTKAQVYSEVADELEAWIRYETGESDPEEE